MSRATHPKNFATGKAGWCDLANLTPVHPGDPNDTGAGALQRQPRFT
ncbi:MAG TPA: hypothetical protein VLF21_03220 [Candidatus Saccharimonadales bacterium]|nr:hypothetical protein [Candidatus Saccharimonadales bacterium]